MLKEEIALDIILAIIDRGIYGPLNNSSNEAIGKSFAVLYNSILENLNVEETEEV